MKTYLFQSCGHCWAFQICCHIECSTFTTSSFRIWNSSTGVPSPSLALFVVILPKAHLTLNSRMSGSWWVITPSWLSGSWRSFLYSSSVYSSHLFEHLLLLLDPYQFVYCAHLHMKCFLGISNFLEEISGLPHSIVFLYFFPLITEEGFLISPCFSLELYIQMVYLSFSPLPFASLLFSIICKASSDNYFALLHFFSLGIVWSPPPVQCHKPLSIIHQTLCLSDLVP